MHSIAFMEIMYVIISILTPLILINIVVYIVKKEIIKTTLRRSLKVFLAALVIICLIGLITSLYHSKQPKQDPLIMKHN
jgi:Trk-type K+ transport system membrane component